MLDIGWSELLVIAIVLIVVVGPKDLPPMIRAFGKTMASLRKMAGDFRAQFDDALKEADMDDVRQTLSDVRNLNPTNSLRDAMNPLRQLSNEIRADLEGSVKPSSSAASSAPEGAPAVSLDEPEMKLPDGPPPVAPAAPAVPPATAPVQATAPATGPVASVAAAAQTAVEKPKRTRRPAAATSAQEVEAEAVAAKPKRAPRTVAAKSTGTKATAPKADKADVLIKAAGKTPKKTASVKSAIAKSESVQQAATPVKTVKTIKAKKGET